MPSAEQRIIEASRRILDASDRPIRRPQFAKSHGCMRAKFTVEPNLPPEYRVGLFDQPATYEALVRFSNARHQDDRRPDLHGMAIKVRGVEGGRADHPAFQASGDVDFLLVDSPTFFARNVAGYAAFVEALEAAYGPDPSVTRRVLWFLERERAARIDMAVRLAAKGRLGTLARLMSTGSRPFSNPLAATYWGVTPYAFEPRQPGRAGDGRVMKFAARPVPPRVDVVVHGPKGPDSSRQALAHHLTLADATFEFRVQVARPGRRTPLDQANSGWKEKHARSTLVATLTIDRVPDFDPEVSPEFAEGLVFDPWNTLKAHEPRGKINRARREVYTALEDVRLRSNGLVPDDGPPPAQAPPRPRPTVPPDEPTATDPSTFAAVLEDELKLIQHRRGVADPDPARPARNDDQRLKQARVRSLHLHTTGLTFSGGGIRSATFAVGFLQGLATLRLIRHLDYLSTVSGGGYAGGWLAAWLRRDGDVENVERQLDVSRVDQSRARRPFLNPNQSGGEPEVVDEEPEPVRNLRAFSSYLFPHPGLFSADTWTVIAIWLRNVAINLMLLVPVGVLLAILARLVVHVFELMNGSTIDRGGPLASSILWLLLIFGCGGALYAMVRNSMVVARIRKGGQAPYWRGRRASDVIIRTVLWPGIVASACIAIFLRYTLWQIGTDLSRPISAARPDWTHPIGRALWWLRSALDGWPWLRDALRDNDGLLGWPNLLLHVALFSTFTTAGSLIVGVMKGTGTHHGYRRRYLQAAAMAGVTAGVLVVLVEVLIRGFADARRPDLMATFAPPLMLLVAVAAMIVEVALLGRAAREGEREWWARLGALMIMASLAWMGLASTLLYVPGLFLAAVGPTKAAITSGWLVSTAFGVLTGKYATALPKGSGKGWGVGLLTSLAALASLVFLVGLLGAVGLLTAWLVNVPDLASVQGDFSGRFSSYLEGVRQATLGRLLIVGLVTFGLYRMARRLIDVNLFSLHSMYANRLIRCYLGASRPNPDWARRWRTPRDPRASAGAPSLHPSLPNSPPARDPNPATGFDEGDDLPLRELRIAPPAGQAPTREYRGPHLLINATLNLVAGEDLAWRDRKGESFTLSPLYCGAKGVGYSKIDHAGGNLSLGRCVAISGGAVDPNMGYLQSPPLTALLTLFNARLGYWIEKPKPVGWTAKSPQFGDLLIGEFFGRTDSSGEFVHTTDGGHFENLGAYELIRRRCRYVVVVDAGEDGDASDENLANLIRLCRIDFGVRIKVDTSPLKMDGDGLSRAHAVIGRIFYDDVDQGEMPGVLLYVKISRTGDEPPDVQEYARTNKDFPHQATDFRQSFDESQFESYRCLGDHIAREVFADAVNECAASCDQGHQRYIPRLFSRLQARWGEAPPDWDERYITSGDGWAGIHRDLASNPDLASFSREIYPELMTPPPANGHVGDPDRAELHMVNRMLSVMENAWLQLRLESDSNLPNNRGWLNCFRRWVDTRAFRRYWPSVRSEFVPEFVRFCEDQLHLAAAPAAAIRLPGPASTLTPGTFFGDSILRLAEEYDRDWPAESRGGRGILDLLNGASGLGLPAAEFPAWLIVESPAGPTSAALSPEKIAYGIIAAAPYAHPDPGRAGYDLEFFVWMGRGVRSMGLASACLDTPLEEVKALRSRLAQPPRAPRALWAHYPRAAPIEDIEYESWVNFLARYNFRKQYPPAGASWDRSLLVLDGA